MLKITRLLRPLKFESVYLGCYLGVFFRGQNFKWFQLKSGECKLIHYLEAYRVNIELSIKLGLIINGSETSLKFFCSPIFEQTPQRCVCKFS